MPNIYKLSELKKADILSIISNISKGAVAIFPTETVYGIVCDARNNESVSRIYQMKDRSFIKPLSVFVNSVEKIHDLVNFDQRFNDLIYGNMPGKLTIVSRYKGDKGISEKIFGQLYAQKERKLGIRIPDHAILDLFLKNIDFPVASTSANISGENAIVSIKDIPEKIKNSIDIMVEYDDGCDGEPSDVVDISDEKMVFLRGNGSRLKLGKDL